MTVILVVVLSLMSSVECLNLLLIPEAQGSHILMFSRLGAGLASRGHSVSILLPHNAKLSLVDDVIDIHTYQGAGGDTHAADSGVVNELMVKAKFATSTWESVKISSRIGNMVLPIATEECHSFLDNKQLREELQAKKFDFAVMDVVGPCTLNYPIVLGVDYFLFSVPGIGWIYRVPYLPSFIPGLFLGKFSDEMGFSERFVNTVYSFLVYYVLWDKSNPIDMTKYPPYEHIPDLNAIIENASLWFWLDEPAMSYPRPSMPNTISIGDIMATESKPLPVKFQQFLDEAPYGVILLSLGSSVNRLPDDVGNKICAALANVSQKVIWKTKEPPSCAAALRNKVMVVEWTPQNDILAHSNLKLFITHCGWNSMFESLYHAKPMVGFPVALDQPENAVLLEKLRYGKYLNLADFSAEELLSLIKHVTSSKLINERVKLGSALIRDKLDTPAGRADYWIRHVAKYGSDHLRTGAFKLKVHEFLMLDVYLTLFVLVVMIGIILCCALRFTCKCLKRCCWRKESSKDKLE